MQLKSYCEIIKCYNSFLKLCNTYTGKGADIYVSLIHVLMKAKIILLIDDNEEDNHTTRQLLMKNEIAEHIIVESSAKHALRFLDGIHYHADQIPDYIFLAIRMAEMDGFDFMDEYALLPAAIKDHCTVFMLTSSDDKKDADRAAHYSSVKKYLRKPLDVNLLKTLDSSILKS